MLTPKQTAQLLRAAAGAIEAEARALSDAALARHPAPGEWCVKEVIGHLIEAERRGFAGRIRIILDAREPALQAWDQNDVARAREDCRRDLEPLLREFLDLRAESAYLCEGLASDDLGRGGMHPKVGRLTVNDLLHEWVHHDRNHIKQILSNVQAMVWPDMGNAQGFAGE